MSRNYKFHNPEGLYFVSFAVVEWLDVFTRNEYKDILIPGWGIGWEGGRIVTKIPGYHENLRAPTRKWIEKTFGITPWK